MRVAGLAVHGQEIISRYAPENFSAAAHRSPVHGIVNDNRFTRPCRLHNGGLPILSARIPK